MGKNYLTVQIHGGDVVEVVGRDDWALRQLIDAAGKGCTPIDNPAPRWSGYIYSLRQLGLTVETVHEKHAGPFPGTHARYVLRSEVTILPIREAA